MDELLLLLLAASAVGLDHNEREAFRNQKTREDVRARVCYLTLLTSVARVFVCMIATLRMFKYSLWESLAVVFITKRTDVKAWTPRH